MSVSQSEECLSIGNQMPFRVPNFSGYQIFETSPLPEIWVLWKLSQETSYRDFDWGFMDILIRYTFGWLSRHISQVYDANVGHISSGLFGY